MARNHIAGRSSKERRVHHRCSHRKGQGDSRGSLILRVVHGADTPCTSWRINAEWNRHPSIHMSPILMWINRLQTRLVCELALLVTTGRSFPALARVYSRTESRSKGRIQRCYQHFWVRPGGHSPKNFLCNGNVWDSTRKKTCKRVVRISLDAMETSNFSKISPRSSKKCRLAKIICVGRNGL